MWKKWTPLTSGPTPIASGGKAAEDTPLAASQKPRVLEKIPRQLEASFLIFLTLGSIKQSNIHFHIIP